MQLTLELHNLQLTTKTKQRRQAKSALKAQGVDVEVSTDALRAAFLRGDV